MEASHDRRNGDGGRAPEHDGGDNPTMISVATGPPGLVLTVHGSLEDGGDDLLAEVVRAALVTVKRANRIHLDLRGVWPEPRAMPRVVQRLTRAGATISRAVVRHATPPPGRSPTPTPSPAAAHASATRPPLP